MENNNLSKSHSFNNCTINCKFFWALQFLKTLKINVYVCLLRWSHSTLSYFSTLQRIISKVYFNIYRRGMALLANSGFRTTLNLSVFSLLFLLPPFSLLSSSFHPHSGFLFVDEGILTWRILKKNCKPHMRFSACGDPFPCKIRT